MRRPRQSFTLPKLAQITGPSSHHLAAPDLFILWSVRWRRPQLSPRSGRVENVRYRLLGLVLTTTTTTNPYGTLSSCYKFKVSLYLGLLQIKYWTDVPADEQPWVAIRRWLLPYLVNYVQCIRWWWQDSCMTFMFMCVCYVHDYWVTTRETAQFVISIDSACICIVILITFLKPWRGKFVFALVHGTAAIRRQPATANLLVCQTAKTAKLAAPSC